MEGRQARPRQIQAAADLESSLNVLYCPFSEGTPFFQRDIGRIDDRLDTIQQQLTPSVPAPVPSIPSTGNKHNSP